MQGFSRAILALTVVAACATAVAAAELTPEQQARLDELLMEQKDTELGKLISELEASKDAPPAQENDMPSMTALGDQIKALKTSMETVSPGANNGMMASVISDAVSKAIGNSPVLSRLVHEQDRIKTELTRSLVDSSKASRESLESFREGMAGKINELNDALAEQAAARKRTEQAMDAKLAEIQLKVDAAVAAKKAANAREREREAATPSKPQGDTDPGLKMDPMTVRTHEAKPVPDGPDALEALAMELAGEEPPKPKQTQKKRKATKKKRQ